MLDVVDFQLGVSNARKASGEALKDFLTGGRAAQFLGNIERGIQGPFYGGANASYLDFHLASTFHMVQFSTFDPLIKAGKLEDPYAQFPKIAAVLEQILGLESASKVTKPILIDRFCMKQEEADAY